MNVHARIKRVILTSYLHGTGCIKHQDFVTYQRDSFSFKSCIIFLEPTLWDLSENTTEFNHMKIKLQI
jgi:hypothetical protein